jgi:apolipoprotein N-acyltransferase
MTRKSRKPKRESVVARPDTQGRSPRYLDGVLLPSMLSAICLWAAFAPLSFSPLAWVAPLGWLMIVQREKPVGRGGYFSLWLSGCLFWLLILHGIRLAFWPLIFGWLLLSLYLAVYVPLFVGAARLLMQRWRVPLTVAAPVAWVGMEMIRSYAITGFAGNTLAHSQAHYPIVIQLADQLGTGGIGFVMMCVCAAVLEFAAAMRAKTPSRAIGSIGSIVTASLLFAGLMTYGWWKLAEADKLEASREPLLRVMLVQENTPTIFEYDRERNRVAWTRYLTTTREGAMEHGVLDLVVWPESTFTGNEPLVLTDFQRGVTPELRAEGVDEARMIQYEQDMRRAFDSKVQAALAAAVGRQPWDSQDDNSVRYPSLLIGHEIQTYDSEGRDIRNAALFVGPDGNIVSRYEKMHLVMVGEYLPLGPALRWLGDLFGQVNVRAGTEPKSFSMVSPEGEVNLSPNICFESMVPHLIRRQVQSLTRDGQSPQVLVNISNDSWFRGSSALDHHLASSILVAVENRRPMLVAANTGITAEISGAGRVKQATQRLTAATLLAKPKLDSRSGLVQGIGYPLGWLCAAFSGLVLLLGAMQRRNSQHRVEEKSTAISDTTSS